MRAAIRAGRRGAGEAVWLAIGLWGADYLIYLVSSYAEHGRVPGYHFAMYGAVAVPGLALCAAVYAAIRLERGWSPLRRALLVAAVATACAALQSGADALIVRLFLGKFEPRSLEDLPVVAMAVMNFLIYVWLYSLYAAVLGLLLSRYAMQDRERQLAQARSEAHQAQLTALRFQLNPHFLFNTLNAISSLIVTGRNAEAEAMTGKLSDFLRASLASDPQNLIPLRDELAQVKAYLDIERERFGERMTVQIHCPKGLLDAAAPSLILQPLVENAVKYAVAPARRAVLVRVQVQEKDDALQVLVEDDGDGDATAFAPGAGVGLENIRRRLEVLYGERARLEAGRLPGGGWRAALRYPLEMAVPAQIGRAA